MPADGGAVEISLLIDGEKFDFELKKAEASANKGAGKIANSFEKIKTKWTELASKLNIVQNVYSQITAVVGNLAAKAREAVAAAEERIVLDKKLLALSKNRADYSKKGYIQDLAFVKTLSNATGYAATEIQDSLIQFKTFVNISPEMARKGMQSVADIAAATGGNIKDIAIGLSKALDNPLEQANALADRGIMINKEKLKSLNGHLERQKFLLQEIASQYGGAASGGINQLQAQQNKLKEISANIGTTLKPISIAWAKIKLAAAKTISSMVTGLANWITGATNVSKAATEAATAVEMYKTENKKIENINKLSARYDELSSKTARTKAEQQELNSIMQKLVKTLPEAATGFDKYGKALGINTKMVKKATEEMKISAEVMLASKMGDLADQIAQAGQNWKSVKYAQKVVRQGVKSIAKDISLSASYLTDGGASGGGNDPVITFDTGVDMPSRAPALAREAGDRSARVLLAERAKEASKAAGNYKILAEYAYTHDRVSEHILAKMNSYERSVGRTTLELKEWKEEFKKSKAGLKALIQEMPELGSLSFIKQFQVLREMQNVYAENLGPRVEREALNNLIKQAKAEEAAERKKRKNAAAQSAADTKSKQEHLELLKMIEKLKDVGDTEVKLKVRAELEPWFEKLGIKDRKIRLQIQAMFEERDLQGAYKALRKYTKGAPKKNLISQDVVQNLGIKVSNIRQQANKALDEAYRSSVSSLFFDYENKLEDINKKFAEPLASHWKAYSQAVKDGNDKRAKELKQRIDTLKKAKKLEKQIVKMDAVKTSLESFKTAFDATVTGIKSMSTGSFKGITSGISGISGGIGGFLEKTGISKQGGIIGGAVSTVAGLVGGIGDLFSSEAETAQEAWQRVFDLTQAQYNYELSKEKELSTQIQKRMELYSYLEKIYGEDTEEAYESQKKLLEENIDLIVSKFSSRGTIDIDGQSYDVSDITAMQDAELEKLLTALSQNENKTSEVAKNAVLYQFQVLRNALANGAGQAEAYNELVRLMYTEMGAESGIYSLGQFMDSHGNSGGQGVEDINQNIQSFLAWYEYASASAENLTSELETYIDQEQELLDLEEARTDELEKQLGLQYKISDEILEQLRALGNAKINSILDEMKELELKIATNQILEGSSEATALRESIMARLMAVTNSLGETNLTSALSVSRADLLEEYDETSYKKMAGIMKKFGFATGGFTGYGNNGDIAGFVHKNEVVLNSKQTEALARLFDVPSHDVASIIPNLPSIMSSASSSPVVNLTQQINISGTSQEIIDKVSKTIRYDTLNAIDDALRRVGGNL